MAYYNHVCGHKSVHTTICKSALNEVLFIHCPKLDISSIHTHGVCSECPQYTSAQEASRNPSSAIPVDPVVHQPQAVRMPISVEEFIQDNVNLDYNASTDLQEWAALIARQHHISFTHSAPRDTGFSREQPVQRRSTNRRTNDGKQQQSGSSNS